MPSRETRRGAARREAPLIFLRVFLGELALEVGLSYVKRLPPAGAQCIILRLALPCEQHLYIVNGAIYTSCLWRHLYIGQWRRLFVLHGRCGKCRAVPVGKQPGLCECAPLSCDSDTAGGFGMRHWQERD